MPNNCESAKTSPTRTSVGLNIAIPSDLHRLVKSEAALRGITLRDAVVAALAEWVG